MEAIHEMTKFLIICFWALSILLVIVVMYRLQQAAQDNAEKSLRIKEDEIEKDVHNKSLDELVDINNKSRKS